MSTLMRVGADWGGPGTFKPLSSTTSGAQRVGQAHGRFHDATLAGRVYRGGGGLLAINNVTFSLATLGATCTPVIGLWNPMNTNKYLSVMQAQLAAIMTALTATGPGGFVWAVSSANAALTLGSVPWNAASLQQAGSVARWYAGTALTGLTNNLVVVQGSGLGGGSVFNISVIGTAAGLHTQQATAVENFDGSLIIPPGGVLALLTTTTPVAHSVVPGIMWEEMPFLVQT